MEASPSSRNAILDAAEELFARQGFVRTTIKQIAARARINSALLYYYFASKEGLYIETLRRLIEGLARRAEGGMEAAATPEDGVRQLVRAQAGFLLAHPNAPRLIARELIDHGGRHTGSLVPIIAAGPFARLREWIEAGQRQGRFRPELDPRFAAISTVAQVAYVALARPVVGTLLGHGPDGPPPEVLDRYAAHAAEFAVAALRVPGAVEPVGS
jgi:AcrR family transcriptional regulator